MEGAGNGSDSSYWRHFPMFFNNNNNLINSNNNNGSGSGSFCGNLTDAVNASGGFAELRCDGEGGFDGGDHGDANPVIIAIIITALYSIVCAVGLVGNVLVMYIILR